MKCKIWNYRGHQFKAFLEADGLSADKISASLDLDSNINKIFKAGTGSGKSGSFFFYSFDNKLIIKTVEEAEKSLLISMLDELKGHVTVATRNSSLLARIYGLFSIVTSQFSKVSFILMQNTIQLQDPNSHRVTFDLKGSQINRYVQLKEHRHFWRRHFNCRQVLKDLNFQEI